MDTPCRAFRRQVGDGQRLQPAGAGEHEANGRERAVGVARVSANGAVMDVFFPIAALEVEQAQGHVSQTEEHFHFDG